MTEPSVEHLVQTIEQLRAALAEAHSMLQTGCKNTPFGTRYHGIKPKVQEDVLQVLKRGLFAKRTWESPMNSKAARAS